MEHDPLVKTASPFGGASVTMCRNIGTKIIQHWNDVLYPDPRKVGAKDEHDIRMLQNLARHADLHVEE